LKILGVKNTVLVWEFSSVAEHMQSVFWAWVQSPTLKKKTKNKKTHHHHQKSPLPPPKKTNMAQLYFCVLLLVLAVNLIGLRSAQEVRNTHLGMSGRCFQRGLTKGAPCPDYGQQQPQVLGAQME
jgi:hypothetical protein